MASASFVAVSLVLITSLLVMSGAYFSDDRLSGTEVLAGAVSGGGQGEETTVRNGKRWHCSSLDHDSSYCNLSFYLSFLLSIFLYSFFHVFLSLLSSFSSLFLIHYSFSLLCFVPFVFLSLL